MRTEVEFVSKDHEHGDWKAGERGYIDGYATVNGTSYASVVVYASDLGYTRIVICKPYLLKPLRLMTNPIKL